MKEKGFTLIELLAVIVILAIIALIAVPVILGVVEKARLGSAESSALGYVDAIEKQISINLLDKEQDDIIEGTYTIEELTNLGVKVKGTKPSSGEVIINNKVETATLCIGNYKVEYKNNKATATKDSSCTNNEEEPVIYKESILNGADPVLDSGMIPVTIENDGTVKKADLYSKWYDYNNKLWANAVLVSSDVRESYNNGDIIPENKILAYFVWIPRYEYETINSTTPTEIKINFISKSITTATSNYIINPAFTFGSAELNGIWAGKFETTGTASIPTIKPNITSLRNQNVSSELKTSFAFGNRLLNNDGSITNNEDKTTYGLVSESRMMKNTEWGAIAYLSHSKYGINNEVRINNNSGFITGCGASTENGAATTNCQIKYGESSTYPQSTTGNITGIFDMSGGAYEWVMGVMEDATGSKIPFSSYSAEYSSGFKGKYTQGGTNTTGITYPNQKYYDLYTYGTTNNDSIAYNRKILGDATTETKGWYSDSAQFVYSEIPWFSRGGDYSGGASAGMYHFIPGSARAINNFSFHIVVTTN